MIPPSSRTEMARLLDEARIARNLSIRNAARLADVPAATIQGWLSGKHLPTPALRSNFRRLVETLDLGDRIPADWANLDSAITSIRSSEPPYLGLRPFTAADAALYFGRDAEARRLAQRVADAPGGAGLVAVVGPSGSGKSSLLAAGLLGKECSPGGMLDGMRGESLVPADLVAAETDAPLVVVDQFEDILTLPSGPDHSLAALVRLAENAVVVLGVRSDAFAQLADFSALRPALEHPLILSPMTDADVRAVVEEPTRSRGVTVEPGLAELILRDLAPGDDGPVALDALPLLSNALLVTWGVGQGRQMTVADYRRSGGLTAAVESLSEGVFAELSPADQDAARSVFLRLVRLNDHGVVRQRVPIAQLADAKPIVDAFVSARILTASYTDVQISHDALLTQWPRLSGWIADGLDDLRVRGNLARATQLWLDHEKATDALLPVDRLPAFAALTQGDTERTLSPDERDFLGASRAHFTSQLDAEKKTSAKLRVRSRIAMGMTAAAAALALIAGVSTVQARGVQAQAQSRQVAVQAGTLHAQDPNLQAQMAVVGNAIASTLESRSALLDATAVDTPRRWTGDGSAVLAVSREGDLVARADGKGNVTLWRGDELAQGPGTTFNVDPAGRPLWNVSLVTLGARRLLAVGGSGGFAALWDVTGTPRLAADLTRGAASTYALAFDSGRGLLALGASDGSIRIVSLADPESPSQFAELSLGVQNLKGLTLTIDAARGRLYAGGAVERLASWDITGPQPSALPDLVYSPGTKSVVQCLAVSPDGHWLVAGLGAQAIARWDLSSGSPVALPLNTGFPNWFNAVGFSADSTQLVTGDSDQKVRVFDAATMVEQRTLSGPALFVGAAFAGPTVVASSVDGSVWTWPSQTRGIRSGGGAIYQLSTDAAGRWLVGTSAVDQHVYLWDLRDDVRLSTALAAPAGARLTSAAWITADGQHLYSGTKNGEVVRWDLTDAGPGTPTVHSVLPPKSSVVSVATNPAGTLLAAGHYGGEQTVVQRIEADGTLTPLATLATPTPQGITFDSTGRLLQVGVVGGVQVWDLIDPAHPALATTIPKALASASAFAYSSARLAVGADDGEVSVYDLADPTAPRLIASFHDSRSPIYSLTFTTDDSRVIAGGGDEVFWGWDVGSSGGPLFATSARAGRTTEGRFIKGGTLFAGSATDGSVRLWTLDAAAARTAICANRGTSLTSDEWTRHLPGITPFDPCTGG